MGCKMFEQIKSGKGAAALEYAVIASLIALGIVVSISVLGDTVRAFYESVAARFP